MVLIQASSCAAGPRLVILPYHDNFIFIMKCVPITSTCTCVYIGFVLYRDQHEYLGLKKSWHPIPSDPLPAKIFSRNFHIKAYILSLRSFPPFLSFLMYIRYQVNAKKLPRGVKRISRRWWSSRIESEKFKISLKLLKITVQHEKQDFFIGSHHTKINNKISWNPQTSENIFENPNILRKIWLKIFKQVI